MAKSICSREHLERLACLISFKLKQAENSYNQDKKAYSTLYGLYRRQAEWICSVMNQIEDYENERVVINPPTLSEHIEIQGPFEIKPKPITSTHPYSAIDIIYLDSDPVGVIVIAYGNGFVNAHIQFERIEGAWQVTYGNIALFEYGFQYCYLVPRPSAWVMATNFTA